MKKILIISVSFIYFLNGVMAQDIIQNFDENFYLLRENGLKKLIFQKAKDKLPIVLLEEVNNEQTNTLDRSSSITEILTIEYDDNVAGILYYNRSILSYVLYDITGNKRKILNFKNLKVLQAMSNQFSSGQFNLINPYYVVEIKDGSENENKIYHFYRNGHVQIYEAIGYPESNKLMLNPKLNDNDK